MIIIQRPIKVSSIIKVGVAGLIALKILKLPQNFGEIWRNSLKF